MPDEFIDRYRCEAEQVDDRRAFDILRVFLAGFLDDHLVAICPQFMARMDGFCPFIKRTNQFQNIIGRLNQSGAFADQHIAAP